MVSEVKDIHAALIAKCRNGNRFAQSEIYRLYAKAMFHVSWRIVQNREDAEDILQESFVDAFGKIQAFRGDSTFGAWLKRIVINKSINFVNKKKLVTTELQETIQLIDEEQPETAPPDVSVEEIKRAMNNLSDGYRIIFSLYMFEDYSHKQIADTLGITESTSKSQLNRAKKRLAELLMQ